LFRRDRAASSKKGAIKPNARNREVVCTVEVGIVCGTKKGGPPPSWSSTKGGAGNHPDAIQGTGEKKKIPPTDRLYKLRGCKYLNVKEKRLPSTYGRYGATGSVRRLLIKKVRDVSPGGFGGGNPVATGKKQGGSRPKIERLGSDWAINKRGPRKGALEEEPVVGGHTFGIFVYAFWEENTSSD